MPHLSKLLIGIGIALIAAGLLYWLLGNKLQWFGNLPGDIRIQKEHFSLYAPITSMLLISAAFSLLLWVVRKFWGG